MRKLVLLTLTALLAGLACSKPSAERSLDEMLFEVNPDLIAESVTLELLNITFHPPGHWLTVSDSVFQQFSDFAAANANSGEFLRHEPAAVFIKRQNQSMLIISRIITSGPMTLEQIADEIQKQSDFDQGGRKVKRNRFLKDDILMEQLFMEDMLRIVIKIICQNPQGETIQLDFTVLKTEYENESKAIESAIGTFMWYHK